MITDFFISFSFFLVPYLTGRLFTQRTVFAWIAGVLTWFILFFPISWICTATGFNFSLTIRAIVVVLSILSLADIIRNFTLEKPKIVIKDKLPILGLIIFSSLIYFLIWKRNTPYPLIVNWDIYEHITLANLISDGNLSLLTSKISDTFTVNSYSPIFHVLLSIPKILFQKSLLGIYWWLEYWFYLSTVIGTFIVAKKLFNSKSVAIMAAVMGSLVFESMVSYSPLFLIPQTLVALVTVLVFKDLREIKLRQLLISGLFIFLLHYVVGALCILVLTASYFIYRLKLSGTVLNIMVAVSFFAASLLTLFNFLGSWQVINQEEAGHFTFQIWEKAGFFVGWYGLGLFILMILGLIKIIRNGDTTKKLVLALSILILGISFAPISYFLKFYSLGGYFVIFVMALGMEFLLTKLPKTVKVLGFLYIVSILILIFYKNQLVYKNPLHFKNLETQISSGEIKAGEWLSQNKKPGYFLISDPGTQYILEAVSGVNTQGGTYMDPLTRKDLMSINNSQNPVFIKNSLSKIHDNLETPNKTTIFVVGGRYFDWQQLPLDQKESTFYNIWSPRVMTEEDRSYVNFLSNHFELLYKNDELAIFKI